MITLVGAPQRAAGVQLIGEMEGSGYRTPPALVRRGDGQTLQLTPLLYQVLCAVDGDRGHEEIADRVGRATGRAVTAEDVRTLVDGHLRPLGLLQRPDGSDPVLRRSDPLLGLALKFRITNPRTTRLLTDPFRFLFRPAVAVAAFIGFVAVTWWVFFERGLAASAYDAFQRPHLLVLVFVVSVLSGGFHEFGHAAAARYGGAQPGAIGGGIYLVWPAFYTDVTDSYRLGRAGRLRTDLGGLYFNALVVVLTFAWWYFSGWEALLLLVATQIMQMVQQLLPLLRFDGYHVLADLAGVPDLYHRIRPTLRELLPDRWFTREKHVLKPWSRVVITAWVLVTIPMLALMLVAVLMTTPRLLATAWAVVQEDVASILPAWREDGPIDGAAQVLEVLGVVLPSLACVLILGRVGVRWFRGLAVWSRDSLPRRVAAAVLSAVMVTLVSWAWWPHPGTYVPIGPDDQGRLTALLPTQQPLPTTTRARPTYSIAGATAERRLSGTETLTATFPAGSVPTRDRPQLAMVLVPTTGNGGGATPSADPGWLPSAADDPPRAADDPWSPTDDPPGTTVEPPGTTVDPPTAADPPWVFPFDRPPPPADGDNQALAVNTTDDSVVYDVAFALVWADGDQVLNVNSAHAYASCERCVTVAVAFQVVLIVDDAQVVVPQNLAVAANYECVQCITAAIAHQLVLTVDGPPGDDDLLALADLWNQLLELGNTITSYTLDEIRTQLTDIAAQIVTILGAATPVPDATDDTDTPTTSVPTSTPTDTGSIAPSTSPSPTEPSSAPPAPSATTSPAAPTQPSDTQQSDTSPDPTADPSPTPDPSPTTSDSPPSTTPSEQPSPTETTSPTP